MLTIGFARRVPSYKRLTLMLRDPERLKRLLLHPERPVQLVIAGKSHPADDGGKKLIQEMVRFADDPEVRHRIVFLPNYDIAMAQPLYPGCDVWLNNPLRPYEACGTSGMKAALNGGLNLSILDGWWDEWYDGDNGWAIPSADGVDDPDRRDDLEATALYDLIENEVAPRFYDVDDDGVPDALARDGAPHAEVARPQGARHPDGRATTSASSTRPAARHRPQAQRRLPAAPPSSPRGSSGSAPAGPASGSSTSRASGVGDAPEVGAALTVRAFVSLGDLSPDDVDVQLVHGVVNGEDDLRRHHGRVASRLAESYEGGRHRFDGTVTLDAQRPVRLHRPGPAEARPPRLARRARRRRPACLTRLRLDAAGLHGLAQHQHATAARA